MNTKNSKANTNSVSRTMNIVYADVICARCGQYHQVPAGACKPCPRCGQKSCSED